MHLEMSSIPYRLIYAAVECHTEICKLTLSALSVLLCAVPRVYCFWDPEPLTKGAKFNVGV